MEMATNDEAILGAFNGDWNPRANDAMGNRNGKAPLTPDLPTSAGFNAYRRRFNTSQSYTVKHITELDRLMAKHRAAAFEALTVKPFQNQCESMGLGYTAKDELDLDEIFAACDRAAEVESTLKLKLQQLLREQDNDGNDYSPSRRTKVDFWPSDDSEPNGNGNPQADNAMGNRTGKSPLTPDSPTSASFNAHELSLNTSQKYAVKGIRELDQIMAKHRAAEIEADAKEALTFKLSQNKYLSVGLDDTLEELDDNTEDEIDLDEIMAYHGVGKVKGTFKRKLPELLHDQDTDGNDYCRSRRNRSDFRPSNDSDGMPSSSRGPQQVNSRQDVSITDQTDDCPFEDEDDDVGEIKMYLVKGTIRKWVTRDKVRQFIANKFREFLLTYVSPKSEHADSEYLWKINEMVSANKCSFEIDLNHFIPIHSNISTWLFEAPQSVLDVMEEVASKIVFDRYPNYKKIHHKIYVRITNFPAYDEMRSISYTLLNTMIRIGGIVTRCSCVFPELQQVKYDCNKCRTTLGPFLHNSYSQVKVGSCPECQSNGLFTVNVEQTIYSNYQKLTLQESPRALPAGKLPRYMEVILMNDLIDCARPGDEIEVTGIYTSNFDFSLNTKEGFPVFATVIEANSVTKKQDIFKANKLTEEDKEEIVKLSKDPRLGERIIKSIAPSIYGHEDIKTAIALAMFGGQENTVQGKYQLRGNIHVLLTGDPGTAKSLFLKYVEKTAQSAVYTTGTRAFAVGPTTAVGTDPVMPEWTFDGGALVLADRGICLIDDFDKMNDQDRVSIHEAMEQQSISILKAGIFTSLQARCSVIATENPIGGRYDSMKTFSQNIELADPLISSFDILCVLKDMVDPVTDEMQAKFVVDSHFNSQPKGADHWWMDDSQDDLQSSITQMDPLIIPQELLRKYITYAKLNVFPRFHDADLDKLAQVNAELRAFLNGQGVPVAERRIESVIRLSEAHARMHLRQHVTQEDVDLAIRLLVDSFFSTQKVCVQKALLKIFKKFMMFKKDSNAIVLHLLSGLVKDALQFEEIVSGSTSSLTHVDVKVEELQRMALDYGITDLEPFFTSPEFAGANFVLDEGRGTIRHRVAHS